jgi:drug/metabolite transporter (DMT)-like permease
MELWASVSIAAAFAQNLRSALQKSLTGRVGLLGAAYARFVFAAPLAALLAAALIASPGRAAPAPTDAFVLWAGVGAVSQIGGTLLLLHLFSLRNFAVGNTFAKTETVQSAVLGLLLLGDRLGIWPVAGILVSLSGIFALSTRGLGRGAWNAAAGVGIASGAAFALSAVAYRAAALALEGEAGFFMRAVATLAFVTTLQALLMTAGLALRAPGVIGAVLRAWRVAAPAGAAGMLGSLGWFVAFTLTPAAQVKAVGQVELVFSWLTGRIIFGERTTVREVVGIALVSGGIVLLVLTS